MLSLCLAPHRLSSGLSSEPPQYWGTELYPRVLGWDVKQFTNCRFGMMSWVLLPLVFAHKSMATHGGVLSNAFIVNIVLQLIYTAKVRTTGIGRWRRECEVGNRV